MPLLYRGGKGSIPSTVFLYFSRIMCSTNKSGNQTLRSCSPFSSFRKSLEKKGRLHIKKTFIFFLFLNDAARLAKSNRFLKMSRLRSCVAGRRNLIKLCPSRDLENGNSHVEPWAQVAAGAQEMNIGSFLCCSRGKFVGGVHTMLING